MTNEEFNSFIQDAKKLSTSNDYEAALAILERAHVLAQDAGWQHLIIHIEMLRLAFEYKKLEEVLGQIPRILLAVVGSVTGFYPKGNVGSTKMGIFESAKKPERL